MANQKRIKIALIHTNDPADKKIWSGSLFHIYQSLKKYSGDVYHLGSLQTLTKKLFYVLTLLLRVILKKNYSYDHNYLVSKIHAKSIKNKLSKESFDVIFAVAASTELAFLETQIPVVYFSDCTFALLANTPYFPDLLDLSVKEGNYIEKSAIKNSDLIIYTSHWAKNSAINDYHADSEKIHVIPFGANIDEIPSETAIMERINNDTCNLLFLAVDWERKGGEIAFNTFLNLNKLGVDSTLTICGCVPPSEFSHENLLVIPFLDKNDEKQSKQLSELILDSNFHILPTRYDCTPISICDASAFGLPTISTDVGGVSDVVEPGKNGFLLDLDAQGKDYAEIIKKIYLDDDRYYKLIRSTRETFDNKFNWDLWGIEVSKLIKNLLVQD